jgi:hypothetical protein
MKKNQQHKQGLFEMIEKETLANFRARKGFVFSEETVEREKRILQKLQGGRELKKGQRQQDRKPWGPALQRVQTLFNEQLNPVQAGHKYPIMARNTTKAKNGRRFVYLGVDGDIHIGRNGSPVKVPRA